jgi:hypothetical protein
MERGLISNTSSRIQLYGTSLGHVSSSRLRFLASTRALENLKTCNISDFSRCKLANFLLYLLIEVFLFHLHYLI